MKATISKLTRLFFKANHGAEMRTLLPGDEFKVIAKIPGNVVLEDDGNMPIVVKQENVVISYGDEEREAV